MLIEKKIQCSKCAEIVQQHLNNWAIYQVKCITALFDGSLPFETPENINYGCAINFKLFRYGFVQPDQIKGIIYDNFR